MLRIEFLHFHADLNWPLWIFTVYDVGTVVLISGISDIIIYDFLLSES